MELERLKTALGKMEDPRRTVGGHILHKLEDIIIIGLCTLLCNGEDFTDMEAFGELRHVVSAIVAENQLVLGEVVTEEKSNEITAVAELLDCLNVEGSIVTADAMSCQKTIVQKIHNGKADYVIGLKGTQPALLENISLYFQDFSKELPCLVTLYAQL